MFIRHYILAMLEGTPKQAFEVGKTFSDVIAMFNRAIWLLVLSNLILIARHHLGGDLAWWQGWIMSASSIVFGFAIPAILITQVMFFVVRSVAQLRNRRLHPALTAVTVMVYVGVVSIAFQTASLVELYYHKLEQERHATEERIAAVEKTQTDLLREILARMPTGSGLVGGTGTNGVQLPEELIPSP